jgi:ABC-type polysaccharide/polyol phosphate export permease
MMESERQSQKPEFVIAPPTLFSNLDVRELVAYRGLMASLFRRRIRTEFDRQHFAFLWVIARPALLVICFSLFKRLSSAETGGAVPYALFVYSGIVFWYFFADAVMETASSIRNDSAIIQKVYFPRLISPVVALLANSYLLAIALLPVVGLMIYVSRRAFSAAAACFRAVVFIGVRLGLFVCSDLNHQQRLGKISWFCFVRWHIYFAGFLLASDDS